MIIFKTFQGLENFYIKFQDFPYYSRICTNPGNNSLFAVRVAAARGFVAATRWKTPASASTPSTTSSCCTCRNSIDLHPEHMETLTVNPWHESPLLVSMYWLVPLFWSSSLETGVYSLGRNIHLLTSKAAFLCDFGASYLLTYLLPWFLPWIWVIECGFFI